ncbi:MAG: hypothetical protein Q8L69_14495 [Gallionellaceae bacterium]|nr:hypothetical protein [Gallionellaceae bacterium]
MGTTAFNLKRSCVHRALALSLLAYSLVGCASPVPPSAKSTPPGEVRSPAGRTVRAIISFQLPVTSSMELTEAVAAACQCNPVYVRTMAGNALIYMISLPQGQGFPDFEKILMRDASRLGIVAVEQDRLEHF